jgi:hypothetical protein
MRIIGMVVTDGITMVVTGLTASGGSGVRLASGILARHSGTGYRDMAGVGDVGLVADGIHFTSK